MSTGEHKGNILEVAVEMMRRGSFQNAPQKCGIYHVVLLTSPLHYGGMRCPQISCAKQGMEYDQEWQNFMQGFQKRGECGSACVLQGRLGTCKKHSMQRRKELDATEVCCTHR
jgi:hypothetical protein